MSFPAPRATPDPVSAFGLVLDSEFPLADLPAAQGGPRIPLRQGPVPAVLPEARSRGTLFQARPGTLLLNVPGVARFLVEQGSTLTVEPVAGADPDDLAGWLLGPVVAALLQQRGSLVLHGAGVQLGTGATLVLGGPGVGKSTLALGLARKGRGVLSCDLCVLDEEARVAPGLPFVRAWDDAIRGLGMDPEGLPRARSDRPKRRVPLGERFVPRALPADRILLLEVTDQARPRLDPLESARERLQVLLEHTYRRAYLKGMGLLDRHFQQCRDLADRLPCQRLGRPEGMPCEAFAAWVAETLG